MVARAGFTLVEALVALVLSSIVVVLVSSVFLVQNRYYATQVQRSGAHDVARAATEFLAREVRSAMAGGVTVAEPDSLVIRSPMVVAAVCGTSSTYAYVQFEGGEAALDQDEVAGVGVYDAAAGSWAFYNEGWGSGGLDGGTTFAAVGCATNGADTTGAMEEFHRIDRLVSLHGSVPLPGTLLTLFRETTFTIRPSRLAPGVQGLFVGSWGDTLVEYASGLDTTAGFQYLREGQSVYEDQVSSAQLDQIDVIRFIADARRPAPTGGVADIRYGWTVSIPLRNAR